MARRLMIVVLTIATSSTNRNYDCTARSILHPIEMGRKTETARFDRFDLVVSFASRLSLAQRPHKRQQQQTADQWSDGRQ